MLAFDTALAQHLSAIDSHGKERMVQLPSLLLLASKPLRFMVSPTRVRARNGSLPSQMRQQSRPVIPFKWPGPPHPTLSPEK